MYANLCVEEKRQTPRSTVTTPTHLFHGQVEKSPKIRAMCNSIMFCKTSGAGHCSIVMDLSHKPLKSGFPVKGRWSVRNSTSFGYPLATLSPREHTSRPPMADADAFSAFMALREYAS